MITPKERKEQEIARIREMFSAMYDGRGTLIHTVNIIAMETGYSPRTVWNYCHDLK